MCNISDKRDNKPMYDGSHYFDIPFDNKKATNPCNTMPKKELLKRNNETLSSPRKNVANVETGPKVSSVVKSSKAGDPNDNEETAHFVFFDMED